MNDDLKLLIQLGTIDDVECVALTDADHVAGGIPRWAEVRLDITRDGKQLQHYLTRHDGEAITFAVLKAMHPNAGRSVSGALWSKLDEAFAAIMESDGAEKLRKQGEALGIATAIALVRSLSAPDIDAVRREAKERYEAATA